MRSIVKVDANDRDKAPWIETINKADRPGQGHCHRGAAKRLPTLTSPPSAVAIAKMMRELKYIQQGCYRRGRRRTWTTASSKQATGKPKSALGY